jgi:RNAse (barnase) inhibitor barstar
MQQRTFIIDGKDFTTLEGFYDVFGRTVLPGVTWGRNLDAFDDALFGDVGDLHSGDTIVWKNPMLSRMCLGYDETVRQLERQFLGADPSQHNGIREAIALAKTKKGETVFDWLVEIFREHEDITLILG